MTKIGLMVITASASSVGLWQRNPAMVVMAGSKDL